MNYEGVAGKRSRHTPIAPAKEARELVCVSPTREEGRRNQEPHQIIDLFAEVSSHPVSSRP